jgi:nucleotide-binding universal stress UspA family protein
MEIKRTGTARPDTGGVVCSLKETPMKAFRRVLVPVDGSPTSNKALVAALQVARDAGGRIRLVHSFDELGYLSGYEYAGQLAALGREYGTKVLAEAAEIAKAAGVDHDTRLVESPGRGLGPTMADEANAWEADLVVVGSHGRRGFDRLVMGSGAEQIIRCAAVPVLVIRASADAG